MPRLAVDRARGLLLSNLAETNGDLQAASQSSVLLKHVLSFNPDDIASLVAFGVASQILGRDDLANQQWKQVLKINPDHERSLGYLAVTAEAAKSYGEAAGYLKRFIEVNPWRSTVYRRYARVLAKAGRLNDAILAANQSLVLDPSNAETHLWLSKSYQFLREQSKSQYHRRMHERLTGRSK